MKECTRCHEMKTEAEYYSNITTSDGKQSWCNVCYQKHKHTNKKHCPRCNLYRKPFDGDICNTCTMIIHSRLGTPVDLRKYPTV